MTSKIITIIQRAQKENSTILNLNHLSLFTIPEEVFELINLEQLIISNNKLSEIPNDISRLKKLKYIDASFNFITKIHSEIEQIQSLEVLKLNKNWLQCIPKSIYFLNNLKSLQIEDNYVYEIDSSIGNLKSLRELLLTRNSIKNLPSNIGGLKNLVTLNISNNKIEDIPREISELSKLKHFNFSNNNIKKIPKEFGKIKSIESLFYYKNPLVYPPIEIVHQGTSSIINYLQSIYENETIKIYESKVLIVGEGGVGKTCLCKRLIYNKVNISEITTEGIEINNWTLSTKKSDKFKINLWDFGGQEIYHTTHQFFLTKRSLYIFVWEARKNDNLISFDYWLNVIKLLGDNAPVIMVLNKMDERILNIDEKSLLRKFPNIKGFYRISATKNLGIDELIRSIITEIDNLPHIGDELPVEWQRIRTDLGQLKKSHISYNQYLEICAKYGLEEEKANYLGMYYHDLGVFLNFRDNPILSDIVFLEPEWATNAVYKVADTRHIIDNFGNFDFHELKLIWDNYPEDKYIHLLELMKKFELCFQIPNTCQYIIPELLRPEMPDKIENWKDDDMLIFEYRYDFMPKGIITRFIVRIHDLIKNDLYWKHGVIIERSESTSLIVSEPLNRRLVIQIKGYKKSNLLEIIRREIDYIHKTLNSPNVIEMIPCICKECRSSKSPYYFDYEKVLKAESKLKTKIECQNSFEDIGISNLLHEYRSYTSTSKSKTIIKNINIKDSNTNFSDNIKIENNYEN
nr:COR domain-containing protein [uncultured Draconibacterium sp.]